MNFAGGDAFLKNPAVRTKFLKVDFGEPGPIFENRSVCGNSENSISVTAMRFCGNSENSISVTAMWFCEKGENSILVTAVQFCEKSENSILVTVARILKNLRSARNLERLILTALRHFPKMLRCCGFLKTGEACEFMSPAVL